MEEINAVDALVEYPKKHNIEYDCHGRTQRFFVAPRDPMLNKKLVVFKKEDLFFIAFDSHGTKACSSALFSGLYGLIDLPKDIDIKVTRKDWTDSFLTFGKHKTGNSYVDKKLTIKNEGAKIPGGLITHRATDHFLRICDKSYPVKLIIAHDYFRVVPDLAEKMLIGIEVDRWIYDHSEIDNLLRYGPPLIEEIRLAARNR